VKTSIESPFVPRLRNFRNLQFAKALISLKLKFQWPGQVHNSSSSPTFSHGLGPKPTDLRLGNMSAFDPGCVKTLFKSKFAANLPDFRKLQFAKVLISLKLKLGRLGFNHNLIRSLTFSHSLDPEQTSSNFRLA
jgi:hypothetical protein